MTREQEQTKAEPIGCGKPLVATDRIGLTVKLPCGDVDDFGVRQFCHTCNARKYAARTK